MGYYEGTAMYHYAYLLADKLRAAGLDVGITRAKITDNPSLTARGKQAKGADMLTPGSVSIFTQKTAVIDGVTYTLGNHRRAYVNSTQGRAEIAEEQPEDIVVAIMTIWGDSPTVVIDVELDNPE